MIIFTTAAFTACLLEGAHSQGLRGASLGFLGILFFATVSRLAIVFTNWLTTLFMRPHLLPRMDFTKEIPSESSAIVVVPTIITGPENIAHLLDALEVRFLANRDENLFFVLLTDFRDAHEEKLPEDEHLLLLARQGIEELNEKYRASKGDIFFLFHRPRLFNPQDRIWMGYERKRGKLAELNSFLRGGPRDCFSLIVGNVETLWKVKYIITLDTDTQLPRDAGRQLVGAMAHPLNRPQFDKDKECVIAGYGILQPRVAVSLPGTSKSRYARMWGNDAGIDPYTRVVSDVYQDLFEEGSFIGKGIYEIDAFEQVLKGRFPENLILSHDLIEGCFVRAGLLSDVQLYEDYPSRYSADVNRRHRWIRGDWQIAQWVLPNVPGADGSRRRNPLSLLSRWKILDNLRRSLSPFALTLLMLSGWTILPLPWFWTLSVVGIILLPSLLASLLDLFRKPGDVLSGQHIVRTLQAAGRGLGQIAFELTCLPYEAAFSIDAIFRIIWRMVARKHLLEWSPSSDAGRNSRKGLTGACRTMWISPVIAVSTTIYLAVSRPQSLAVALPVLFLWFTSPLIAWWISEPLKHSKPKLSFDQLIFLRKISRKIWAFFETFVGPEDHWLPPDNYQEGPLTRIAHRTSPTNMGLALLANLSAWDFGYISTGQLIDRTANAFRTMDTMDRYKGHFYNWYDTLSLQPLQPVYISSLDSGNLAAHLLTLRTGFVGLSDEKICGPKVFEGLNNTIQVLMDIAGEAAPARLVQIRKDLESLCTEQPDTLHVILEGLGKLETSAREVIHYFNADPESQAAWWAYAFAAQCRAAIDEVEFLCPWTTWAFSTTLMDDIPDLDSVPTLSQLANLDKRLSPAIVNAHGQGAGNEYGPRSARKGVVPTDFLMKGTAQASITDCIMEATIRAKTRCGIIGDLVRRSGELADMEYDFLYDETRRLLAIGYNVTDSRRDDSYYDLLASEARLSTFVAIAQGQLPQESWFALGRLLTTAAGGSILLSWSGSMFEYLMPLLVMPTYGQTLLDETCKAAVARQIEYGKKLGIPWGVSESGYNSIDSHFNYQYSSFGVPGLGLRRGLAGELVIAPYASALALMVALKRPA
jgi:hypothetical protein